MKRKQILYNLIPFIPVFGMIVLGEFIGKIKEPYYFPLRNKWVYYGSLAAQGGCGILLGVLYIHSTH